MILTSQQYRGERHKRTDEHQSFTATVEMEGKRKYLIVQLDNFSRWMSKDAYADYLRWVADEIEKLPVEV